MKNNKSIIFVVSFFLITVIAIISCNSNIDTPDSTVSKIEYEMSKLVNVAELDALLTRGDDNIVDWQLSKEFAELWLEEGIANGEYPNDSELWEVPIAVYSSDGSIKYYEFRIINGGETVGAIVGAATKNYGCPIVYEGLKVGYADEITELYNNGKLTSEQLPRIVDDGYPRVVAGVINETKGAVNSFTGFLDLKTGETLSEDEINKLLNYYQVKENNPEIVADLSDQKMQAAIDDYESTGEAFWDMAVANKGHIADFAVRGTAKNEPSNIKSGLRLYWDYVNKQHGYVSSIVNYDACGAVAEGFVLDYLSGNGLANDSWKNIRDTSTKKSILYNRLEIFPVFGNENIGEATWPWKLGNAIKEYSNYKTSLSICVVPEKAIDNGLPGISLRVFNTHGGGFNHYRPVIAYKKPGWWIFKWHEMKVLDLIDCYDTREGSWETYHPLNHFLMYNVVKK